MNSYRLQVVAVVALLASMVGWAYLQADRAEKAGKVLIPEALVDYGTIAMEEGPVSKDIAITNAGDAVLVIQRLSTSCGCTTAEMDISDMAPGETRIMTVTFDPRVHSDQTGPIVRVVYLQTSDPETPEAEIDVRATVMKKTRP